MPELFFGAGSEVLRALRQFGSDAVWRGEDALTRIDPVRISGRLVRRAGRLMPPELRSLDAIHLATAVSLGADLHSVCTYDPRMAHAAERLNLKVVAPT